MASSATQRCKRRGATISPHSPPRSAAAISAYSPPRLPAATVTPNSSSAPAVVERLVIDHVGHLGDGVALVEGRSLFVPYTLGGEAVEVTAPAGHHPDRRQLVRIAQAS